MKKHTLVEMQARLVHHPSETNPTYSSRIFFFHQAPDRRLVTYYWEAPVGTIPSLYESFDELMFILEGRIEVQTGIGQKFSPGMTASNSHALTAR